MDRQLIQNRLERFGVDTIQLCKNLEDNLAGRNIASQLVRSGTSPALNYAESQSAESRKDFIHKLGIVLKELRETSASLRIIEKAGLSSNKKLLTELQAECNQLAAIFVSSIKTTYNNPASRG